MVFMPSARQRDELLSVPSYCRLTMTRVDDLSDRYPALLLKHSSLGLKYLVSTGTLSAVRFKGAGAQGYGVEIADDSANPSILWSVVEEEEELQALNAIASGSELHVHMFNDLALNVASARSTPELNNSELMDFLSEVSPRGPDTYRVDRLNASGPDRGTSFARLFIARDVEWQEQRNYGFGTRDGASIISIFETDEGRQQENFASWLMDGLHWSGSSLGATDRTAIPNRELTDLIVSDLVSAVLVESKTLSIWSRAVLPSRAKLSSDVAKHVIKATKQLAGAVRAIRSEHQIVDSKGIAIRVLPNAILSCIILVPELSLLSGHSEFGPQYFAKFKSANGCELVILDPTALLRLVQNAELSARDDPRISVLDAFEVWIAKRFEVGLGFADPSFDVLVDR